MPILQFTKLNTVVRDPDPPLVTRLDKSRIQKFEHTLGTTFVSDACRTSMHGHLIAQYFGQDH
jgi:hypothetical protein